MKGEMDRPAFDKAVRALGLDPLTSWADEIDPLPYTGTSGTIWDASNFLRGIEDDENGAGQFTNFPKLAGIHDVVQQIR